MECYIEILNEEYLVEYDYEIISKGGPAKTSGPPEDCYPEEPLEFDLKDISLWTCKWIDATEFKKGYWTKDKKLDLPEWLEDDIIDYLYELDKVYEDIDENEIECKHLGYEN